MLGCAVLVRLSDIGLNIDDIIYHLCHGMMKCQSTLFYIEESQRHRLGGATRALAQTTF